MPPKDNIVSYKVAVKIRGICQSCGSLASCIALGQMAAPPSEAASRKEVVYGMGQRTRKIVMILNTILFVASLDLQGDWT